MGSREEFPILVVGGVDEGRRKKEGGRKSRPSILWKMGTVGSISGLWMIH